MTYGRSLERYLKRFDLPLNYTGWARIAQNRDDWRRRVTQPPFVIGKPFVRRPRGDTRRTPEQRREDEARRGRDRRATGQLRRRLPRTPQHLSMNCTQPESQRCQPSTPAGGHHKKKADKNQEAPPGLNHPSTLTQAPCTTAPVQHPPFLVLGLTRIERAHFNPQHWLLCHMGLY